MCEYKFECRKLFIIYKVTYKFCGDLYVGNTKNTLKKNGTKASERIF